MRRELWKKRAKKNTLKSSSRMVAGRSLTNEHPVAETRDSRPKALAQKIRSQDDEQERQKIAYTPCKHSSRFYSAFRYSFKKKFYLYRSNTFYPVARYNNGTRISVDILSLHWLFLERNCLLSRRAWMPETSILLTRILAKRFIVGRTMRVFLDQKLEFI